MSLLTLGAGSEGNMASQLQGAYMQRVAGDGGTVEASPCAVDKMSAMDAAQLLSLATFLLFPSGAKPGTVYAQKPANGNGDLTFTRASTAKRRTQNSLSESVAANLARIDYLLGGCPVLLLEPSRRNELLNAILAGGGIPTSWSRIISGGTVTAVSSIYGNSDGEVAYQFAVPVANRDYIIQLVTTTANITYAFSVEVEGVIGNIRIDEVFGENTGLTGTVKQYYLNGVAVAGSSFATIGRYTMIYSNTVGGGIQFRMGAGIGNASVGTVILSRPQVEIGAYPTRFIPTTTGTVTRAAEGFTRNNLYTNGMIGASGFTWLLEVRNNMIYTRDVGGVGIRISDTSGDIFGSTNAIEISRNSSGAGRLSVIKRLGGAGTFAYLTTADTVKLAIKFDGSTFDVFENGVKVVSGSAFAISPSTLQHIMGYGSDVPKYILQMGLWNVPLTDGQCITLTT